MLCRKQDLRVYQTSHIQHAKVIRKRGHAFFDRTLTEKTSTCTVVPSALFKIPCHFSHNSSLIDLEVIYGQATVLIISSASQGEWEMVFTSQHKQPIGKTGQRTETAGLFTRLFLLIADKMFEVKKAESTPEASEHIHHEYAVDASPRSLLSHAVTP
jgi:hypothetical protein